MPVNISPQSNVESLSISTKAIWSPLECARTERQRNECWPAWKKLAKAGHQR